MATSLFMEGDVASAAYRNIRDAKESVLYRARHYCEYLWIFFQHHADRDFRTELRSEFDARYWEMYLTTSLILAGFSVTCPKPGPDVGIIYNGRRIWFEAVSPTPGDPTSPDYVPQPTTGEVSDTPNEKIVLRYLNSISDKYERQYSNWLAKGIVSDKDAFVIAMNPRQIWHDHFDTTPPRILQAGYTVGSPYMVIDKNTGNAVRSGHHFRGTIAKEKRDGQEKATEIPTGVFQDKKHLALSALLCSRVDAANRPGEMGDDFQLAPNPHATVPLPEGFRLRGTYYESKIVKDGYDVTPIESA
jgi:hypothetical protein